MLKRLPKAKMFGVVIQNLDDEVLVYDLSTNKAHNLNKTTSIVFNACDGLTTIEELKNKNKLPDEIIYFALDELRRCSLLDESVDYISPFRGMSRREVIHKVGLASVIALPIISSLVAPNAVAAGSCVNTGGFAPGTDVGGGACGRPDTPLCQTLCNLAFYQNQCCSGITTLGGSPCPDCTCLCA